MNDDYLRFLAQKRVSVAPSGFDISDLRPSPVLSSQTGGA